MCMLMLFSLTYIHDGDKLDVSSGSVNHSALIIIYSTFFDGSTDFFCKVLKYGITKGLIP